MDLIYGKLLWNSGRGRRPFRKTRKSRETFSTWSRQSRPGGEKGKSFMLKPTKPAIDRILKGKRLIFLWISPGNSLRLKIIYVDGSQPLLIVKHLGLFARLPPPPPLKPFSDFVSKFWVRVMVYFPKIHRSDHSHRRSFSDRLSDTAKTDCPNFKGCPNLLNFGFVSNARRRYDNLIVCLNKARGKKVEGGCSVAFTNGMEYVRVNTTYKTCVT